VRDGVDGFVVAPDDMDAFVRHTRALLYNAGVRRDFSAAARARAETFSVPRMIDAMTRLYDEVMQ
jgi:glycosyltransferase involved in cell wall biosynthesis